MSKVVLITGGTSGVGLQLVKDFIELGYDVVSISRDEKKIDKVSSEVNAHFICGDITNEDVLVGLYNYIESTFGKLDILINNAGIIHSGGIELLGTDEWDEIMDINVTSVFKLTKVMLPLIKKVDDGNVVNISSISSRLVGSSIAYSTGKAAVDMMTQSLARELVVYGIRVNTINPGLIDTGFQVSNDIVEASKYDVFLEDAKELYPLGIGTPSDVSNFVLFVVSDKAKWVTGSSHIVDGGRSVNI